MSTSSPIRHGSAAAVIVASIVLVILLGRLMYWQLGRSKTAGEPLLVYCAASQKLAMTKVVEQYEQQFGVKIELQFGGSQTLLTNAELSNKGDLFLPADDSYLELAEGKGLTKESWPLAEMHVMLVVQQGNPLGLHSLDELLKSEARISLAEPDAAAVGKIVRTALQKSGQWPELEKHIIVSKPTVTDATNDVKLGAVDATLAWDAMRPQYEDLAWFDDPSLQQISARVSIGLLASSHAPEAARRFAQFCAASDGGLAIYQEHGFQTLPGKPFSAR